MARYRKIPLLYRVAKDILGRKNVYALEKIHGCSGFLSCNNSLELEFYGGAISAPLFASVLRERYGLENIREGFKTIFNHLTHLRNIKIHGEVCGGKVQRMRDTYGELDFIVFEIKLTDKFGEESWLTVPQAYSWCEAIGLPFVPYEMGPATEKWLSEQRDAPSRLALIKGNGEKNAEGVVIRTLLDTTNKWGDRIIAKYKRAEFAEVKTPRKLLDPDKQAKLVAANEVASEWVTPERLNHAISRLEENGTSCDITVTGKLVGVMIEDVKEESGVLTDDNPEIVWSKHVEKAIGRATAKMFHQLLKDASGLLL